MSDTGEIRDVLQRYCVAWLGGDLDGVIASYHPDFTLHYFGASPLAGTHRGKEAALDILAQATVRSARKLIEIEDVLAGHHRGLIIAIEELGDPPVRCRRLLLYRVEDGLLRECWLYDEDQAFIDGLWSS